MFAHYTVQKRHYFIPSKILEEKRIFNRHQQAELFPISSTTSDTY